MLTNTSIWPKRASASVTAGGVWGGGVPARGGARALRGRSLGGPATPDLTITGAGIYARLHAAGLDTGRTQFGATLNRVGELGWTANAAQPAPDAPFRPLFNLVP